MFAYQSQATYAHLGHLANAGEAAFAGVAAAYEELHNFVPSAAISCAEQLANVAYVCPSWAGLLVPGRSDRPCFCRRASYEANQVRSGRKVSEFVCACVELRKR